MEGKNLFEEMKRLHEEDPDKFESKRKKIIREFISGFPSGQRKRLQSLQDEIEKVIAKSATPLGKLQYFQEFFFNRIYGSGGNLEQILSCCDQVQKILKGEEGEDKITHLKRVK